LRDALAPKLHAAIHEALGADELVFKAQQEVFVGLPRGEKFVLRISLERSADNRAVAHPPDFLHLALPALERLAVEELDRRGVAGRGQGEGKEEEAFHNVHE
jgi:hypothetical protein